MSTIHEQFEAWAKLRGYALDSSPIEQYGNPRTGAAWEVWQAATEAAKATGTVGEPDADAAKRLRLICKMVGIESHVPADDETLWGAAFAVLGQIRAALERDSSPIYFVRQKAGQVSWTECANKLSHDGCMETGVFESRILYAEAARQPAPVVAVKTWQERVSESSRTDRFKVGDCMTDEIAELRAALAATAAPVLSDEQINDLWNALPGIEIHNKASAQGMSTDYALRIAFAHAILAATRSQP